MDAEHKTAGRRAKSRVSYPQIESLAQRVEAGRLTQKAIEAGTGVDQGQISRILRGEFRRQTQNVDKICRYAEALDVEPGQPDKDAVALQNAILEVWNGTPLHAQALIRLLRELGSAQHLARSSRSGSCQEESSSIAFQASKLRRR